MYLSNFNTFEQCACVTVGLFSEFSPITTFSEAMSIYQCRRSITAVTKMRMIVSWWITIDHCSSYDHRQQCISPEYAAHVRRVLN